MYLTCCKQRNKGRTKRIERLRIFNPSFSLPWCCKEEVRKRKKKKKKNIFYQSLCPHSICQRKTRNKENKNTVHTFFFVLFFKSFVSLSCWYFDKKAKQENYNCLNTIRIFFLSQSQQLGKFWNNLPGLLPLSYLTWGNFRDTRLSSCPFLVVHRASSFH